METDLRSPGSPEVIVVDITQPKRVAKPMPKRKKRKNGTGTLFYKSQKKKYCAQASDVHGKLRSKRVVTYTHHYLGNYSQGRVSSAQEFYG